MGYMTIWHHSYCLQTTKHTWFLMFLKSTFNCFVVDVEYYFSIHQWKIKKRYVY